MTELDKLKAENARLSEALACSEAFRRQQVAELEQQVAALRADAELLAFIKTCIGCSRVRREDGKVYFPLVVQTSFDDPDYEYETAMQTIVKAFDAAKSQTS